MRAQQKMKWAADGKRQDVQHNVGDLVFLKLQPYRQKSLAKRPYEKLAARYYGPFPILQRIGAVAYKLQLPLHSKIHPVFHVSQLKKAIGTAPALSTLPPHLSADMELHTEPEKLLEVKRVTRGQHNHLEALIQWKGLPVFEATWEDVAATHHRFPWFHLEDKVNLWGGGIVTPQATKPLLTYAKRNKKG